MIPYEYKDYNGVKFKIIKSIPFHIASKAIVMYTQASEDKVPVKTSDFDALIKDTIKATLKEVDEQQFTPEDLDKDWVPGELYMDTMMKIIDFVEKSSVFKNKKSKSEESLPDDTEDIEDEP